MNENNTSKPQWKAELYQIATFCTMHRGHIGGAMLLLSALCIFNYASREHLPINLTSSTTIISLPAVFTAVALVVVILLCFVLLPTLAAFIPPAYGRTTLMARMHRTRRHVTRRMRFNFLFALSVPALSIAIVVTAFSWLDSSDHATAFNVATLSAIFLSWLAFLQLSSGKKTGQRFLPRFAPDFWLITLGATSAQMLVWITVLQVTMPMFLNASSGLGDFVVLAVLTALVLVCVQTASALVFSQLIQTRTPITYLVLIVSVIVSMACVLPQSGSALAGRVLQTLASGNRSCVVITWSKEGQEDSTLPSSAPHAPTSVPLKIMAETGDIYLARKWPLADRNIIRIPSNAVRSLGSCPDGAKSGQGEPPPITRTPESEDNPRTEVRASSVRSSRN
ncbi:hypothetical protein ISN35_03515 [Xanthomonas translucens pv. undulosa]|uniref:hypothetical protein n=1 Tax=Xanthomonas campestris pv. translucens TaxID=343 RepID=UPI0019D5DAC6|nr:hypothetical protein [Xanthomonas translucens]QSQ42431.1 hypothetical protein ISN33_04305 [Xanthomonas translucens pv. translucens]QSQ49721.1 hypothetical protein ISN35_03515 [Xanthomonas translucens pv. undulosa]